MKHCEKCKKPMKRIKDRFCPACEKYVLTKMENDGYLQHLPASRQSEDFTEKRHVRVREQ